MNGAGAQEESLFRRTNLFMCLDNPNRKSKIIGAIYIQYLCLEQFTQKMQSLLQKTNLLITIF